MKQTAVETEAHMRYIASLSEEILNDVVAGSEHTAKPLHALNVINDLILRGISAQLDHDHEHDTVPICQADLPDSLTHAVKPQAFHAVIHVAMEAFPTPRDDCAWQDILDFKAEAHDKQWGFRRFLKTLATKQQSESEVRDDIEWMVSEYGKAMALHKLKASKTLFEAYIISAVEVLEDLAKFNWTKIAKLGVSAKQRKIQLLDAEMKGPGGNAPTSSRRERGSSSKTGESFLLLYTRSMPVSPESAKKRKRRFSYAERYAVWRCHGPQCSWCHNPLRLIDTTIDHQLPESLLYDDARRAAVFVEYGLPSDFSIDGYENWLPCHNYCNQSKGARTSEFVPGIKAILDRLRAKTKEVERLADSVALNIAKDKVFRTIFAGLEEQTITVLDLDQLLEAFVRDPAAGGVPDDVIILDSGHWVKRENIAHESTCRCERPACVGRKNKVYCYFEAVLSPWVIKKGLFWRCYDEFITCPRCSRKHKRGHIGSEDVCGKPYLNQEAQNDSTDA